MPKSVFLALDGSTKDERGLAVAEAVAELTHAPLHLVRVLAGDAPLDGGTVSRELTAMAGLLGAELGHAVTAKVLAGDDVATTLVRYATEQKPLLLAMATRAPGTVERALRGSVADRVMRECPSPVLLIPPGADYMGGRHLSFARVLVPLDGSELAARALDYLLQLPRAAHLEYALLEVVAHHRERAAAVARLEAEVERVRAVGATVVDFDVAEAHDPARAIVDVVREALVDMIAMSSRGATGLRRLVLGSVAESVIRSSEVPVLLLTPGVLHAQGGDRV